LKRRVIIIGAGGHARVLLSALGAANVRVSGCIARERPGELWPSSIEYLGTDAALQDLDADSTVLVNGIGSTRSTALRQQLFELGKGSGLSFLTVLHSKIFIDEATLLDEGVQVMAGAVVQCGVVLGANSIINTGAIVDHDCRIGAHTHLGPRTCLSGTVNVGNGVHVGAGATVVQGINIGDGAMIAAGAVILDHVPPGVAVAGVPAKPMHPAARS
jgi:sugar O-acyltransferase (sialic acid O-acetyltransferase NeuD family)